jgi:predicted nucleic acid-binding Zn ribbon protein
MVTALSTMRGGKVGLAVDRSRFGTDPAESDDKSADLPATALAEAQSLTRSRPKARKKERARASETQRRGGYSGPRPDDNDPQLVGSVLAGYVEDRGWEQPLAAARVFADWPGLVGEDVAAHCRPATLTAGELKVEAESSAWATQLRLLSSTVLARLVAELGPQVVTKVHFIGPTGPSWKHGGFSVRGARGPRDTYG